MTKAVNEKSQVFNKVVTRVALNTSNSRLIEY